MVTLARICLRLRQFAAEHGGALVDGWKLFGADSLFSGAAESSCTPPAALFLSAPCSS
jgi:hypothetical protein